MLWHCQSYCAWIVVYLLKLINIWRKLATHGRITDRYLTKLIWHHSANFIIPKSCLARSCFGMWITQENKPHFWQVFWQSLILFRLICKRQKPNRASARGTKPNRASLFFPPDLLWQGQIPCEKCGSSYQVQGCRCVWIGGYGGTDDFSDVCGKELQHLTVCLISRQTSEFEAI